MKIKLTTTRETFQNNLFEMGYNYRIKQYDDFINSLHRILKRDVSRAMTDISKFDNIFGEHMSDVSLLVLKENHTFEWINSGYLINIIEEGRLDLYFTEKKEKTFSKEVQLLAYEKIILNNITIDDSFKNNVYNTYRTLRSNSVNKMSYLYKKVDMCISLDKVDLLEEEKNEIKLNLSDIIKISSVAKSSRKRRDILTTYEELYLLEIRQLSVFSAFHDFLIDFLPNIDFDNNYKTHDLELILNMTYEEQVNIKKIYDIYRTLTYSYQVEEKKSKELIYKILNNEKNVKAKYAHIVDLKFLYKALENRTLPKNEEMSIDIVFGSFKKRISFDELDDAIKKYNKKPSIDR